MDMWKSAALARPTQEQAFEQSLVEMVRSEKSAEVGDLTGALDSLLESPAAKTPRLDRLMEQTKLAYRMGRELATKEAGIASQMLSAVKPLAGKALGMAAKNPAAAMGAAGAGLGAIGGAATAQPGHRLGGALGGAALGGAAGYGASKLPGGVGQKLMDHAGGAANMGLNRMGMQMKFAGLGMTAMGAMGGAALGALKPSGGQNAQGLQMQSHHLRNAMIGAAGGAALGQGAKRISTMAGGLGKAEGAAAKIAPRAPMQMAPAASSAEAMGHVSDPVALAQRERVRAMANSPKAREAMMARGKGNLMNAARANPTLAGLKGPTAMNMAQEALDRPMTSNPIAQKIKAMPYTPMRGGAAIDPHAATGMGMKMPSSIDQATSVGGRPQKLAPRPSPTDAALAQWNQKVAGVAFIKRAMAAEPGTDGGGGQEQEGQFLSRPEKVSKPAAELYGALKHLSPKTMRGLQVAQPGT